MLNHSAYVGLNRHYFIICCRGTASTAFPCVAVKKPSCEKVIQEHIIDYLLASSNHDNKNNNNANNIKKSKNQHVMSCVTNE